jgi:hypothetical protein
VKRNLVTGGIPGRTCRGKGGFGAFAYTITRLEIGYVPKVFAAVVKLRKYTSAHILVLIDRENAAAEALSHLQNLTSGRKDVYLLPTVQPLRESELPWSVSTAARVEGNCCGFREYLKLALWSLTKYARVVSLDVDISLISPVDHLFAPGCGLDGLDGLYTPGPGSPWNGGFFVAAPSTAVYDGLVQRLRTSRFSMIDGWDGHGHPSDLCDCKMPQCRAGAQKGHPLCHGAATLQGFLYYYFVTRQLGRVAKLSSCHYDFQGICEVCLAVWRATDWPPYVVHKGGATLQPVFAEARRAHLEGAASPQRQPEATAQTDGGADAVWPFGRLAAPPERIAFIHIPKTGGSAVIETLVKAGLPVCQGGTKLMRLHACSCFKECAQWSTVAVMEIGHNEFLHSLMWPSALKAAASRVMWLSIVREPESWFYSAVGQLCVRGHVLWNTSSCKPNATLETLLSDNWFSEKAPKYYWQHANLQTTMLSDLSLEHNWAVCALPQLPLAMTAVSRIMNWTQVPTLLKTNEQNWEMLPAFKRRIPWELVRSFYVVDEAFYARVAPARCLFSTRDASVRALLQEARFQAVEHWRMPARAAGDRRIA